MSYTNQTIIKGYYQPRSIKTTCHIITFTKTNMTHELNDQKSRFDRIGYSKEELETINRVHIALLFVIITGLVIIVALQFQNYLYSFYRPTARFQPIENVQMWKITTVN